MQINVKLWDAVTQGRTEEVATLLAEGADAQHCAGVTRNLPVLHVSASLLRARPCSGGGAEGGKEGREG